MQTYEASFTPMKALAQNMKSSTIIGIKKANLIKNFAHP